MDLPTFRSMASRRHGKRGNTERRSSTEDTATSEKTATPPVTPPNARVHVRRSPSRRRKVWVLVSTFLYLISTIFLILTLTSSLTPTSLLSKSYLYRLSLTNILSPALPASTATSLPFLNSLARSLGLHDFYQVGLWTYCAGYDTDGITTCSRPVPLYYFDPVSILVSELLAGATITLPAEIVTIIKLIRIASHVMFGCFMAGVVMNFLSIFLSAIALRGKGGWAESFFFFWGLIAMVLTIAASTVGTVMAVVFHRVATSQSELNIGAQIGVKMMCFMWIGAGASLAAWVVVLGGCCRMRKRRRKEKGVGKGERERGLQRKIRWPVKRKTDGEVV